MTTTKKAPHELHRADPAHHDHVAREALDHVEHALLPDPGAPLTAATALAFCLWAGITTEAEAAAASGAPPVSSDELEGLHAVSVLGVGVALPADVVARIASGEVLTNVASPEAITAAANRIRLVGAAMAHLRAAAAFLNKSARSDADMLDAVVEQVYPQVTALAAVDPATALAWRPLISYRQHHHKGGGAHPARATPPAKPQ